MKDYNEVTECKLCKSKKLDQVLHLQPIPIGDKYIPPSDNITDQDVYPMDIMMCGDCGHYQNSGFVSPELIYGHYLSRPATTNTKLSDAYKEYIDYMMENFYDKESSPFVVEAGSNDGAFINHFQERGAKVLGVEPSDLSNQANDNGIATLNSYFGLDCAKKIKKDYGKADFFVANHTFSNIIDLDDFVKGVKHLLAENGVFSMQTHYHLDVIEKNLIENFTHEHLSGFYVKPLRSFFSQYGLELFDVKRVSAKEGSIRCFVQNKGGSNKINKSVDEIIKYEESIGMDQTNRHESIADFVNTIKEKLHNLLSPAVEQGKTISGYGTSIGATTFTYNYDLGGLLTFYVDDDQYRHNLISPGLHIPVYPSKVIYEQKPDYVIILAPLYADIIMKKNQEYLEQGGVFIKIWPEFEVIHA